MIIWGQFRQNDDELDAPLVYNLPCDEDHTYAIVNPFTGRESWHNGPCDCDVVQVGILNGTTRYNVQTTSSDLDNLPF